MKQIIGLSILVFAATSCAIGQLEEAADQLEDVKAKLDELAVADCMVECSYAAQACFEEANLICINECEVEFNACQDKEDICLDSANESCSQYYDAEYYSCFSSLKETCDGSCEQTFSDCGQVCAQQAQDCLFLGPSQETSTDAFAPCVAACVEELENILKDF